MVKKHTINYRSGILTAVKAHFLLAGAYIGQLILFDASKLIPPEVVKERWLSISLFVVACALIGYLVKINPYRTKLHRILILVLTSIDIAFASHNVYLTRGMASRAVILFIVPLCVVALLMSLSALLMTATVCAAVYIATCVSYFVNNFNEGYKVELYGEVGLYSASFYVFAYLLWAVIKNRKVL